MFAFCHGNFRKSDRRIDKNVPNTVHNYIIRSAVMFLFCLLTLSRFTVIVAIPVLLNWLAFIPSHSVTIYLSIDLCMFVRRFSPLQTLPPGPYGQTAGVRNIFPSALCECH